MRPNAASATADAPAVAAPVVVAPASIFTHVTDEYDPMRPNDYEEVGGTASKLEVCYVVILCQPSQPAELEGHRTKQCYAISESHSQRHRFQ